MLILAAVLALAAAALHVVIFRLESLVWGSPAAQAVFGAQSEEEVAATRAMAFNQGFYNLFLAIGATIGIVLFFAGSSDAAVRAAGLALVLFSLGSMVAASLVLLTSGAKYLRPALIQGTLPLIGFVLFLFA